MARIEKEAKTMWQGFKRRKLNVARTERRRKWRQNCNMSYENVAGIEKEAKRV